MNGPAEGTALRPTPAQWVAGARPRTLPAAIAPVLVATALVAYDDDAVLGRALLALVVSLALQVGVNYANDYSDGIRGTDTVRVGPVRLVGSGLAAPQAVRAAAFASFAVAGAAGLLLVVLSQQWWLLAVGAASVAAAWYYTGGKRPYGYLGLGEVFVFVFFGLVATWGTAYVQAGRVSGPVLVAGVAIGALTCAILVANNLRDRAQDAVVGKGTLATRLGDRGTRGLYLALAAAGAIGVVLIAASTTWAALLGLLGWALILPAVRVVLRGGLGPDLITVLKGTGTAELAMAVLLSIGLLLG